MEFASNIVSQIEGLAQDFGGFDSSHLSANLFARKGNEA